MNTTIIIRIDSASKERAKRIADKSRRSLSDYVRLLLEKAVKDEIKV